jgi:uncharacterized membrane protein
VKRREERFVSASYPVSGVAQKEIFEALLEVWRFPEWAYGLKRVRLLGGDDEVRPGSRLSFSLSAAGLGHEVTSTVTEVDPPRSLQWRYTRGAVGTGGWVLEEDGSGAVLVTFSTNFRVEPAWLDKAVNRSFVRGVTDDLLHRSLRRLAAYLLARSRYRSSSSP